MKAGDLVRNKNSESGERGLFVGMRTFKHSTDRSKDYTCAEVYWQDRSEVGTVQTDLIEVISEAK
ncbi:hypothetical protein CL634_10000 [bacterium]|nr:hypothetical protein [bacterium]|tara:strand:+ start:279 stop:473 length:195 start_codon:yes stop_codon:yes gene_type:complete